MILSFFVFTPLQLCKISRENILLKLPCRKIDVKNSSSLRAQNLEDTNTTYTFNRLPFYREVSRGQLVKYYFKSINFLFQDTRLVTFQSCQYFVWNHHELQILLCKLVLKVRFLSVQSVPLHCKLWVYTSYTNQFCESSWTAKLWF